MAGLYKRYIPPRKPAAPTSVPVSAPTASVPKAHQVPIADDGSKKRKRERTDEEIAERKAKKLRKKGIDPATAGQPPPLKVVGDASERPQSAPLTNGTADGAVNKRSSEFAHIRDAKKRHKLEKESRKARKAAAKADKENEPDDLAQEKELSPTNTAKYERDTGRSNNKPAGTEIQSKKQKKKKRKHDIDKDEEQRDLSTKFAINAIPSQKSDGESQAKRADESNVNQSLQASTKNGTLGDPQINGTLPQSKKRRHKLESVLKEPHEVGQPNQTDEDEHSKNHGRVLSKFQKSTKLSRLAQPERTEEEQPGPKPVVLDLAPLPQPEKAVIPKFVNDSSALPKWLAKPTIVSSDSKTSFADLELEPRTVEYLSKLGFADALPVQQALIPILLPPGVAGAQYLPGTESVLPDVAVGAPTGSGKTIAYLLPIVESLRQTAGLGLLRALVVVPTRELVLQVAAVAESLARASSIKVGTATGAGSFKEEQSKLVRQSRRYDPGAYRGFIAKAHMRNYPPPQDSEDFEDYLDRVENQDPKEEQRIKDAVSCLVDHVPTYDSAVDILVTTPGRLLEHVSNTLGFSLAHLEWLVLDEADKLLDLQYDGFLETVNDELSRPRRDDEQDARERYLRSVGSWNEYRERRVRKVVLSATMTKDISKLIELKLKQPKMILVREPKQATESAPGGVVDAEVEGVRQIGDGFELPPTLNEYCVPVGDGREKPLYLVEVLRTRVLSELETSLLHTRKVSDGVDDEPDITDSADSSSDSDSEPDSDTTSSQSSREESASVSPPAENNTPDENHKEQTADDTLIHPERTAMLERLSKRQARPTTVPSVLIFTSSTESANRLSHLLKNLKPQWASWIQTMTKTDPKRKTHSRLLPADPIITISTDRAGRGLDAIGNRNVTHVIQYDVPRSVTGYVHRVGRTARAGRPGDAWTLYSHSEARWYLKDVANAKSIKRSENIEKVKLTIDDEELREHFREVVESMNKEVYGHVDKTK